MEHVLGLREAAREKRHSVDEACPRMATLSCLSLYLWPDAVCALSRRCLVVGKAKTPAGHTLGLASSEPDTGVGISLLSRLQNHDKAETGYTGRDLPLVDILKVEVTATSRSFAESTANISARSERVGIFTNSVL